MSESKLQKAERTHRTDFGTYEDISARFEDTKIETPSGNYICHHDGTFIDMTNKLMWIQAPWGMTYDGRRFKGEPIALNWKGATKLFGKGATIPYPGATLSKEDIDAYVLSDNYEEEGKCVVTFAGSEKWGLPTAKELITISEYSAELREKLFPHLPDISGLDIWSANDRDPRNAWVNHHLYDKLGDKGKDTYNYILFVRRF